MSSKPLVPVRVWDLPLRLFHWLLALCVVASIVTAKVGGEAIVWHFRLGYAAMALLVFRLVWGLVGGHWARFASFVASPMRTWRYVRGGSTQPTVGHNPLGAWSVLAVLGILAVQVGTGLFADDEIANVGPLNPLLSSDWALRLTFWHKEIGAKIIILLVIVHVAAIVWYRRVKGENLITPMVTGDKALPANTPASADGWAQRLLAVVILAAATWGVWALVRWGQSLGGSF
jgi:cytochrome b